MLATKNKTRFISVLTMLAMLFSFANISPALAAGTCIPIGGNQFQCDFVFTGSSDTWTVPAGVGSARFLVYGAKGSSGSGTGAGSGAPGGRADAMITVVPGQTYSIIVGGQNGYPNGGYGGYGGSNGGGNGGGSSEVKLNNAKLIIGGGGGGGGGGLGFSYWGGSGGSGSGGNGSAGGGGQYAFLGGNGGYGSYFGNGSGGYGFSGQYDSNGWPYYSSARGGGGGGGGGGYYGGQGGGGGNVICFSSCIGGGGGGGGGGSSYGPAGTNFSLSSYNGDGHVTIFYTVDTIPPTASPTQSPAANGMGWNNSNVTVAWNWADNASGSGINPASCTTSSLSSGEGNPVTLVATCRDLAGNTGSASYTLKVDKTTPTISGSRSPAANGNGWNNGDVTVSFVCSDALSGLAAGSPPADSVLSGEGGSLSAMGTCTDIAGNPATDTQSGIKIDKTAPNTNLTAPSGWNNVDVTLTLDPNDGLSGVNATYFILDSGSTQTGTSIAISTEGIHTIEYWSVDNADNIEAHHFAEVKIDKTAPTISHSQSPDANGNGWNNGDVTVTFICGDSLSGIASCTAPQLVTSEGQLQDVTGTAFDNAGNSATDPATVSIDKTAPSISASADRSANTYGWYNNDVLVSFTCEDTLSGIVSCPDAQTLGEGANQSASGTATDAADNLSDTALLSGMNVDKTAPTITYTQSPAANLNGWHNGDVTVTWSCSDALSGLDGDCPTEILISGEGMGLSASASVSDLAGNSATETVSVQIDKTAPIISAIATAGGNPYIPGTWTNQDVTVSFECSDDGSGVGTVTDPIVVSTEGADQSVSGTCTDQAGNSASNTQSGINIDMTAPTLSPVVSPNPVLLNGVATITSGAADALSGLTSSSCDALDTSTVGAKSVTCTATDNAGNSNSATVSYSVKLPDDSAPTAAPSISSGTAGANGWYTSDVTVNWNWTDNADGSGIDTANCTTSSTSTGEGNPITLSATCKDLAGNTGNASYDVKVDKTKPTLNPVVSPNPVLLNGVATVTSNAADALSGLASSSCGALDTSTVGAKSVTCTATDNAGNSNSATVSYNVNYNWLGFFQPVDNLPMLNLVKAGQAIPVKFSLAGNQGLNIFAAGYPVSTVTSCGSTATDAIETTVTAGSSSLSYDATTGQYNYVWKTDKAWAGTCRTLTVKLIDGTIHQANFQFTR